MTFKVQLTSFVAQVVTKYHSHISSGSHVYIMIFFALPFNRSHHRMFLAFHTAASLTLTPSSTLIDSLINQSKIQLIRIHYSSPSVSFFYVSGDINQCWVIIFLSILRPSLEANFSPQLNFFY